MSSKEDIEIHMLEIDGFRYRLTSDPWTRDWHIDSPDDYIACIYTLTKEGAIQWCLQDSGLIEDGDYQLAPDRTSS